MRRLAAAALLAAALLAAALLAAGCPPPAEDNPCVKARAALCGEGSPMREGGICARLRADGDRPDDELRKKCVLLLEETK